MRRLTAALLIASAACGGSPSTSPSTSPDPQPTSTPEVPPPQPPPVVAPDHGAIARENRLPGSTAWRLSKTAWNREIEGYALATSVSAGERVPIAVSLPAAGSFTWSVFRLGWYGGARAREVARGGPVQASAQAPCPVDKLTGLVACNWTPSFEVETTATWRSGAYLVKLTRGDGYERYVPFVVRPERRSEIVVVLPTTTWAAYDTWGGTSLYDDATGSGRGRAYRVSFDRPFVRDAGAGHLLSQDGGVITWLEAQGYDVTYASVADVEADENVFDGSRAIVISAHDEYWTGAYRARVDAALARGTSVLNFGANNAYWQVRLDAAADGRPRRIVTCYKDDAPRLDPAGPGSSSLTVRFRDPPVSRPESRLFGVMFNGSWNSWGFPAVVARPDHWLLAGTGLRAGDVLRGVHGYEVDEVVGAAPAGLEVVADSRTLNQYGGVGRAQMVIRQVGPAWVFSAGGIGFAQALGVEGRADASVGRIAANLLARVLGDPLPDPLVRIDDAPAVEATFASSVRTVASGLQAPSAVAVLPTGALAVADAGDGTVRTLTPAGGSTAVASGLQHPVGIAADVDGTLYVSDTGRSCVQQIAPGGAMTVFAGACWSAGSVDGVGTSARFVNPAGLAIKNGVLYVADVGASAIRSVNLRTGTVTTVPAPGLYRPTAVAAAADGSLVVVDSGSRRILSVRSGAVSTVAGDPYAVEGYADGAASRASLLPQLGIAVLADGSIAFSDPGSYRVRRISGGRVTAYAGSGRAGEADGAGGDAALVLPTGLAAAADGTLYVADTGNGAVRAVRP